MTGGRVQTEGGEVGEIEGFPCYLRSPRQSWEQGPALLALATLGQLGLGGGYSPSRS